MNLPGQPRSAILIHHRKEAADAGGADRRILRCPACIVISANPYPILAQELGTRRSDGEVASVHVRGGNSALLCHCAADAACAVQAPLCHGRRHPPIRRHPALRHDPAFRRPDPSPRLGASLRRPPSPQSDPSPRRGPAVRRDSALGKPTLRNDPSLRRPDPSLRTPPSLLLPRASPLRIHPSLPAIPHQCSKRARTARARRRPPTRSAIHSSPIGPADVIPHSPDETAN